MSDNPEYLIIWNLCTPAGTGLKVFYCILETDFSSCPHSNTNRSKVKVKVKVKFTLEQATKAQRGRRGIALLFP
jgi:hypothetical protein